MDIVPIDLPPEQKDKLRGLTCILEAQAERLGSHGSDIDQELKNLRLLIAGTELLRDELVQIAAEKPEAAEAVSMANAVLEHFKSREESWVKLQNSIRQKIAFALQLVPSENISTEAEGFRSLMQNYTSQFLLFGEVRAPERSDLVEWAESYLKNHRPEALQALNKMAFDMLNTLIQHGQIHRLGNLVYFLRSLVQTKEEDVFENAVEFAPFRTEVERLIDLRESQLRPDQKVPGWVEQLRAYFPKRTSQLA